jgi:hypothetical protein
MSTGKISWIIILVLILCLSLSIPVLAANTFDKIEIPGLFNDSTPYQLQLLFKLIADYNPSLAKEQRNLVCKAILSEAKATGFDPFFISSIIAAESSFCPNAVSPCAARGLMQLTACVSNAMNINNPFDIQENIYAGTRFLKYLKGRFSEPNLILAAYNAGPTRVARIGRVPRILETICYIKKVNITYNNLRQKLFSLLQDAAKKPLLCRTIGAIAGKDVSPAHSFLAGNSNYPDPLNSPEGFIYDRKRSFIVFV